MYNTEDISTLRERANILDVAEYLGINPKRSGSSYKALCPFPEHNEKSPSFTLNPQSNTFYCFGCHEHGDTISLVQNIESLTFREAVDFLAARFNMTIREEAGTGPSEESRSKKARLYEINKAAHEAYLTALMDFPEAQAAREELEKRKYNPTHARAFGCGYSPRHQSVCELLRKQGFTLEEVTESGLGSVRYGRLQDTFSGRLMWAIKDAQGRHIGFGARKLYDDDPRANAKFINTAETPVYKKSKVLYGLDMARRQMAATKQAVVVEGYADVMAMHSSGVTNAVASCGTAFTEEHLEIIKRIIGENGEVVFAFDDDKAGRKAARSAFKDFNGKMHRLTALPNSGGLDPDDLRRDKGEQAVRELLDQRIPLTKAVINSTLAESNLDSPEEARVALDSVKPYIESIVDPILRDEYIRYVAETLNFTLSKVQAVLAEISTVPTSMQPKHSTVSQTNDFVIPEHRGAESEILHIMVSAKSMANAYATAQEFDLYIKDEANRQVLQLIRSALTAPNPQGLSFSQLVASLAPSSTLSQYIHELSAQPLPLSATGSLLNVYMMETFTQLEKEYFSAAMDDIKRRMNEANNVDEQRQLMQELIALKQRNS